MLFNKTVLISLVTVVLANKVDRSTITVPPNPAAYPTFSPFSVNDELIYVGEDSDGVIWVDEDNITYLDGEELYDGGESDHEYIDVIDAIDPDEKDLEYDENGYNIEYDDTDPGREWTNPPPKEEWEWDESGQLWKKKECCETLYREKTVTKWVKQKPKTRTVLKTSYKTMLKTVIKTAYKTITKTYKLPVQTTTVKIPVTTTKTYKLPPVTVTETFQKYRTIHKTQTESETYDNPVTKTLHREYTVTETEYLKPTDNCKGKDSC
ncbi:hypothetical protein CJU90_1259 [Yarrowia sp. C11]|nr:hypothetical protein CKK34_2672 [Yarrowia sp. E02]KAG5373544.1 hypothetical protein CJU90_1259 [Yarrowia sp. C11]